jgi:hypothetical protein
MTEPTPAATVPVTPPPLRLVDPLDRSLESGYLRRALAVQGAQLSVAATRPRELLAQFQADVGGG